MDERKVTRRVFLRTAAMTAVGMMVAGCAQPTAEIIEKQVPVEKVVKETVVVEKQVPVEKVVKETVVVEKQVAIEKVVTATPIPAKFHEPPMLAELVKQGKLPPVEERLPLEPMVIPVYEKIGTYGGTMRRAFIAPSDVGSAVGRINACTAIRWTRDGIDVWPYALKAWEPVDGGKSWVCHLREGMKWSDGAPFTADDFMFHWQDIQMNAELTPSKPSWVKGPGGAPVVAEKLGDYTVKYTYSAAFYPLPQMFATLLPASPAHYLKQFHKTYVGDKADELAKANKREKWGQYFTDRSSWNLNTELPVVTPWVMQNTQADSVINLTRNPYYLAVDPEGNQLPYIDAQRHELVSNTDMVVLKAIEGGIDFQARHLQTTAVPVLKENEAKGGYIVKLIPGFGGSDAMFNINTTYAGPEKVVLTNRDFRIGLSLAIDRAFIQQASFVGLGTPSNYLPAPDSPQHPGPEWETKNAVYDVAKAKQLLDSVVPKLDSEGFRTLPDGSRLELVIGLTPAFGPWPDIAEQVVQMWAKVGIRARIDNVERSLLESRLAANELQIYMWGPGRTVNVFVQSDWIDCSQSCPWGREYQNWYATKGEKGIEPPPDVKRLTELVLQGRGLPPEQANPLAREIYKYIIDNQLIIGTVRRSPMVQGVTVVSKRLGNVPETWANDTTFNTPWTAYPEQLYFKS